MEFVENYISRNNHIFIALTDWIRSVGNVTAGFFGFDLSAQNSIILGAILFVLFFFFVGSLLGTALNRIGLNSRTKKDLGLDGDTKKLRSIENRHKINLVKLRNQQEKKFLIEQEQLERNEKNNQKRFRRIHFWEKVRDRLAAVVAATSRRSSIQFQVLSYVTRLEHDGFSVVRAHDHKVQRLVTAENSEARSSLTQLDHVLEANNADLVFLKTLIERVEKQIDENSETSTEERRAEERYRAWEDALGRPVFIDRFTSFFERHLGEWRKSLGHEEAESALKDSSGAQSERSGVRTGIGAAFTGLFRWLGVYVFNWNIFPFFAVPAELAFSYPIFLALADGDRYVAIAGAVVFTSGLMVLGYLAGRAIVRVRYSKVISNGESRVRSTIRVTSTLAAVLFVHVGIATIHTGATLRQNAGEVLRISKQVEKTRDDINRLEDRKLLNFDPATLDELIDNIEKQRDKLMEERRNVIRMSDSPLNNPEGQIALLIFSILFISAAARKIFDYDPVYEFGRSAQHLSQIKKDKSRKKLILNRAKASYEIIGHKLEKTKSLTEKQIEEAQADVNGVERNQLHQESRAILKNQVSSYVYSRALTFCATLSRFRNLADSGVEDLLESLRKKADDLKTE